MTPTPEPEEQELPCFVPEGYDTSDFELPMFVSLKWDDDEVRPASSARADADEGA